MNKSTEQKENPSFMITELDELDIIWSTANVIVLDYNCNNILNTWIPIRWLALDNNLYEVQRIRHSLHLLSQGVYIGGILHYYTSAIVTQE